MSVAIEIAAIEVLEGVERLCALPRCGRSFVAPKRRYCSDACARRAYYERHEQASVKRIVENRARCRAWNDKRPGPHVRNPWLIAAPPYSSHLPGAGCEIEIIPAPHWPIELRNARFLHGVLHHILEEGHNRQPAFVLVPWQSRSGWGVWWWDRREDGQELGESGLRWRRFACRRFEVNLFDRDCVIRFGGAHRVKSPPMPPRGRKRVRIDAITPVHIRATWRGHGDPSCDRPPVVYRHRIVPTASALLSTLRHNLAERLGVALASDDLQLEVISHEATPEYVEMGGKYGRVPGWVGHCVVEANAPARWLLACAERVGLGGRTAFGFGRIRLSEVP